MESVFLGYETTSPSMSTQYFNDPRLARLVQDGNICLSMNNNDPYVFNSQFDNNLIKYNELYYTGVASLKSTTILPTLEYFERKVMKHVRRNSIIIDIGCGQGEFVNALRTQGLKAFGFDPVLKIENEHTNSRYWTSDDFL
jgi:2-polyprenyl-3-methyl-5-hydroxy-6-metoxy-1,4-benzoquinol methylase